MGKLIGITGTPGTGKKTIAPLVAAALGFPCLSLSDLAASFSLVAMVGRSREVDTQRLRVATRRLREPLVLYGHLIPYSIGARSAAKVVVLRCEPSVLRGRLVSRGYPRAKIRRNVEAELIGLIAWDARRAFGAKNTLEYDTTHSEPKMAAKAIARMVHTEGSVGKIIDWTRSYASASRLESLLAGVVDEAGLT